MIFQEKSQLFNDPKIDYPTLNSDLNFADYIKKSIKIIENTRIDLNQHNANDIILANAPFELKPLNGQAKSGALLIHGLLDSSFIMKDIGEKLQKDGVLVRAVLLPGHGTVPGALLNVDYHQWLQTVNYGISSLKKEVDKIFLVGFSTGAALLLYHVLKNQTDIAGLILISPALRINSCLDFTSNWYRLFRFASKRFEWFHIDNEETCDYVKYSSLPFNAIYQVYRLGREIKKLSRPDKPNCPLFFVISEHDATVSTKTNLQYFKNQINPGNRMVLYSTSLNQSPDDTRMTSRPSIFPALNIVSFSHFCIPVAPSNFHYGENGDYPYASRIIQPQKTQYGEYSAFQLEMNQFLLKHHWTDVKYQRLTYNPDFVFLSHQISEFLSKC